MHRRMMQLSLAAVCSTMLHILMCRHPLLSIYCFSSLGRGPAGHGGRGRYAVGMLHTLIPHMLHKERGERWPAPRLHEVGQARQACSPARGQGTDGWRAGQPANLKVAARGRVTPESRSRTRRLSKELNRTNRSHGSTTVTPPGRGRAGALVAS
jgi:hypothetical protein